MSRQHLLKNKHRSKNYKSLLIGLLCYSVLFFLVFALTYTSFFVNGRSFMWDKDGINQHYNALVYYGEWLRQAVSTHTLPQWDLNLGYGMNILTTFHYYVIGEPLNILSYFVSPEQTEFLYDALVVARLYLAGLCFALYCHVRERKQAAIIIGALMYSFSGYAMVAGMGHPFFIAPFIWLPCILIGVEKILSGKSPAIFMLGVCFASISNFYFFYMVVAAVILYVLVRLFTVKQEEPVGKRLVYGLVQLIRFAIYGLCGTLMSMCMLFPILQAFFNSGRGDLKQTVVSLYSAKYYESILATFFEATPLGSWTIVGVAAPAILAIFVLFAQKKQYRHLKISFIILTLVMLLPHAGYVLNGLSYVSNRWCWIYGAFLSYLFVCMWDHFHSLKKREGLVTLCGMLIIFGCLSVFTYGRSENVFSSMFLTMLLFAALIVIPGLFPKEKNKRYMAVTAVTLLIAVINIAVIGHYRFDHLKNNFIENMVEHGSAYEQIHSTGAQAVANVISGDYTVLEEGSYELIDGKAYQEQLADQKAADAEDETTSLADEKQTLKEDASAYINRYEQDIHTVLNASDLVGVPSTAFFWSLANKDVTDFYKEMGLNGAIVHDIRNLNSRTYLDALCGVRYYVRTSENSPLMYGYEKVGNICINPEETEHILKGFMSQGNLTSIQEKILQKKYEDKPEDKEDLSMQEGAEEDSLSEEEVDEAARLTQKEAEEEEQKEIAYFQQQMSILDPYLSAYEVYENQFTLPFGYTYESYMARDDFEKLPLEQKQEALVRNVLIEEEEEEAIKDLPKVKGIKSTAQILEYETEPGKGVLLLEDGSFYVQKENAKVDLVFEEQEDQDYFVTFRNGGIEKKSEPAMYADPMATDYADVILEKIPRLECNDMKREAIYNDEHWYDQSFDITASANNKSSSIRCYNEFYQWPSDQEAYLLNLGHLKNKLDRVTITFSHTGIYHLEDIQVIAQPMEQYENDINKLKEETLTDLVIDTNEISGKISVQKAKLLCMAIPYDEGWSLTVDGEAQPLLKMNGMFMGSYIEKGDHEIHMSYETPGMMDGRKLAVAGFVLFAVLVLAEQFMKKISRKPIRRAKHSSRDI